MREALARRGDPARAVDMQAYMKSHMPYYGMSLASLRAAVREVLAVHALDGCDQWQATVRAMWHAAERREERYAALEILGHRNYKACRTLDALPLYEELIVSGAWWDLVDGIASHQVGDLLRAYPDAMRAHLLAWSRSTDHWLRRTAIICQIASKGATDKALLFACIEPSLREKDFFLRKGIGWALREYGKVAPDAVLKYVREHEHELSGLSKREALKYVPGLQSSVASV